MQVTFYTIHCKACDVLQNRLIEKGVEFETVIDREEMNTLGFTMMPMLIVDGVIMDFMKANNWLKSL